MAKPNFEPRFLLSEGGGISLNIMLSSSRMMAQANVRVGTAPGVFLVWTSGLWVLPCSNYPQILLQMDVRLVLLVNQRLNITGVTWVKNDDPIF